jgi:hypothetical protein
MIITIPLLLLIFGALAFWILIESKLSIILKLICISLFSLFTVQFYFSIESFLGWAAKDMPEKMLIHWITIKEPNPFGGDPGRIYFLIEGEKSQYENQALKMFKYYTNKKEPRLYSIPYSRKMHEQLHSEVMKDLQNGQSVYGSLSKSKGKGKGKGKGGNGNGDGNGEGNGDKNGKGNGQGEGSESIGEGEEFEFHKLTPGEISKK